MREEAESQTVPSPLFSRDLRHRLHPTENPRVPVRRREAPHSGRQAGGMVCQWRKPNIGLVLIDQFAENSEGVGIVRVIDGRLAIPGKVEFGWPL